MSTGPKLRAPDRPAKDTKKLTAELTMCRSGTEDAMRAESYVTL
jgi:hypothetical protein